MKKSILFVMASVAIGIIIVILSFLAVTVLPRDTFAESFMATLKTKYEILKETDEPKIIIISGSSASFSLDNNLLEKETGYKVANIALHAGTGALFETELSKANINKGDIVLLGYEWGWPDEGFFDSFGTDIIMQGIDDKIEMYKYIPLRHYKDILGYLCDFAVKKQAYEGGSTGVYSRSAFDEKGNMVFERNDSPVVSVYNPNTYGCIDVKDKMIDSRTVEYLKEYKEYVENKGARICWIGCPIWSGAIVCEDSDFESIVEQEEELIGIDYISNPIDYIFQDEYMYDTIYHTNTKGQKYRTELLINDLKKAKIVE